MAFTIAALTTEINTDPKALGYATLKAQTNGPEAVAAKLNEAGASAETLFKSYVPIEDVIAAIVISEYAAATAANRTFLENVLLKGSKLKSGDANLRTSMAAIFAAGTTSRANLVALASRSASRAEALWGEGYVVSASQASEAMGG